MATLEERVALLATRLRTKINDMMTRLTPTGGAKGQILVKNSVSNFDYSWQNNRPARLSDFSNYQLDFTEQAINLGFGIARQETAINPAWIIIGAGMGVSCRTVNLPNILGVIEVLFGAESNSTQEQYWGIYCNYGAGGAAPNVQQFIANQTRLLDFISRVFFIGKATQQTTIRIGLFAEPGAAVGSVRGLWFESTPGEAKLSIKYTTGSGTTVTTIVTTFDNVTTTNMTRRFQIIELISSVELYIDGVLVTTLPFSVLPSAGRFAQGLEVFRVGSNNYVQGIRIDYFDLLYVYRTPR